MKADKFWKKVSTCKHEWSPTYYDSGSCGTPYCSWTELRCKKCGVYLTDCGCHAWYSWSGWPTKRWMKLEKKKQRNRRRDKQEKKQP